MYSSGPFASIVIILVNVNTNPIIPNKLYKNDEMTHSVRNDMLKRVEYN